MKRFVFILILLVGCDDFELPKKKAYFAHQFNIPSYATHNENCSYMFKINTAAKLDLDNNCNAVINYKNLSAQIFISNISMDNIDLIKYDFDQKILDNSSNVSRIVSSEFNNPENHVYAQYYSFVGDAPSNIQFYVTDSLTNFIMGSLYFKSKPNYDSLLPSISYVKNDIKMMIETFKWK